MPSAGAALTADNSVISLDYPARTTAHRPFWSEATRTVRPARTIDA
jgi:hypothetical protein